MAATFSIAINDIAIGTNATDTLANIRSILDIPASAVQGFRIVAIDVTFDGTVATNKPVLVQLIRANSATGTFPSSTINPVAENAEANFANEESVVTAANIKYGLASAEGTVASANGWRLWRLPPVAGVVYQLPLGREIYVIKGSSLRVRAVAVNAVNATVNVTVEQ